MTSTVTMAEGAAPGPGGPRATILHYCHHSVGLGHLVRSLAVAGALARQFRVVLCSGGTIPPGLSVPADVELVALPPIGSSDNGRTLASLDPMLSLEQAWERRSQMLLDLLYHLQPAAVVVELFPLGRRKFAGELLPLLEAARGRQPPAAVVCSVRDILAVVEGARQQERDDKAAERLNRYFAAVVVHSDPRLARLEDTFRPSLDVVAPILYTGFVVPDGGRPLVGRPHPDQVVVSAGGGLVGGPLLETAAEAHRLFLEPLGITTRLVTGPFLPEADASRLEASARRSRRLSVERFVPDLGAAMASASVSVSQCGYNTALDVVRAGVPALVVPHDLDGETEQSERARRLARLGALRVLAQGDLSAARLAEEILDLIGVAPPPLVLDLEGARTTSAIVARLVRQAAGSGPAGASS